MHQTPTCVAGFSHSSFVFGYEAFVHRTNIGANQVPPGALVSFLQRGIQYVEMQSNLNEVWPPGPPLHGPWLLSASALTMDLSAWRPKATSPASGSP